MTLPMTASSFVESPGLMGPLLMWSLAAAFAVGFGAVFYLIGTKIVKRRKGKKA